jgi:hypothetical protein
VLDFVCFCVFGLECDNGGGLKEGMEGGRRKKAAWLLYYFLSIFWFFSLRMVAKNLCPIV